MVRLWFDVSDLFMTFEYTTQVDFLNLLQQSKP